MWKQDFKSRKSNLEFCELFANVPEKGSRIFLYIKLAIEIQIKMKLYVWVYWNKVNVEIYEP